MSLAAILALLEKGLTVLPTLVSAGVDIYNLATRLAAVAKAAKEGQTVPRSEAEALEAELDAALAEFNSPIPPAA